MKDNKSCLTDSEQWLRLNSFFCKALNGRISKPQCERIQKRPYLEESLSIYTGKGIEVPARPDRCNSLCPYFEGNEYNTYKIGTWKKAVDGILKRSGKTVAAISREIDIDSEYLQRIRLIRSIPSKEEVREKIIQYLKKNGEERWVLLGGDGLSIKILKRRSSRA